MNTDNPTIGYQFPVTLHFKSPCGQESMTVISGIVTAISIGDEPQHISYFARLTSDQQKDFVGRTPYKTTMTLFGRTTETELNNPSTLDGKHELAYGGVVCNTP